MLPTVMAELEPALLLVLAAVSAAYILYSPLTYVMFTGIPTKKHYTYFLAELFPAYNITSYLTFLSKNDIFVKEKQSNVESTKAFKYSSSKSKFVLIFPTHPSSSC